MKTTTETEPGTQAELPGLPANLPIGDGREGSYEDIEVEQYTNVAQTAAELGEEARLADAGLS